MFPSFWMRRPTFCQCTSLGRVLVELFLFCSTGCFSSAKQGNFPAPSSFRRGFLGWRQREKRLIDSARLLVFVSRRNRKSQDKSWHNFWVKNFHLEFCPIVHLVELNFARLFARKIIYRNFVPVEEILQVGCFDRSPTWFVFFSLVERPLRVLQVLFTWCSKLNPFRQTNKTFTRRLFMAPLGFHV